jgi:hypothetical protein
MIMEALHTMNHKDIISDAVSAFAVDQIWVGIRCGDFPPFAARAVPEIVLEPRERFETDV